jgi:hypothetical protein
MAVTGAQQAGHDLMAGYMLSSLAAFETDGGDPELGLNLISEARRQIGATPHPAPRAWLDATEALSFAAARRDGNAASTALARAVPVIDRDGGHTGMHARLSGAHQARTRPGSGTGPLSSGYAHRSLPLVPVRYSSVR